LVVINNRAVVDEAAPLRRLGPRLRGDDDFRVAYPSTNE